MFQGRIRLQCNMEAVERGRKASVDGHCFSSVSRGFFKHSCSTGDKNSSEGWPWFTALGIRDDISNHDVNRNIQRGVHIAIKTTGYQCVWRMLECLRTNEPISISPIEDNRPSLKSSLELSLVKSVFSRIRNTFRDKRPICYGNLKHMAYKRKVEVSDTSATLDFFLT
jgi:hypothetical protein